MLPLRYIIIIITILIMAACMREQSPEELSLSEAEKPPASFLLPWASPQPPSSYYTLRFLDVTANVDTNQIRIRKPEVPIWLSSKHAPQITEKRTKPKSMLVYDSERANIANRLPKTDPHRYFSIGFDNDVFFSMDYYYTNGIQFQYFHPGMEKSLPYGLTIPYRRPSLNYYGMKLVQNMYTPTRLDVTYILENDRPFASYLYLGYEKITFDPGRKIKINSGLDIGMLGPTSLGGLIQTTLHNTEPTGWVNQIGNDIVLSYTAGIEKGIVEKDFFSFNMKGSAIAGTLYDNLQLDASILVGRYEPYFQGMGLHCGRDRTYRHNIQYAFRVQAKGTLVGYDATLQGGLFNKDNPYSLEADDILRFTFAAETGFFFRYRWLELEAGVFYLTPEFKSGKDHKWVHLSATFCL
ncbi:MAG: lipid A deacylase LpxR family protein [Bacteroidetes bacterium]|nr:lipid A deacylase LpxR family protein [Bacteroidota bacterium]